MYYFPLILIKIAIAKNINKIPITIKAILKTLDMVELPVVSTLATLLTLEELEFDELFPSSSRVR